MNTGKEPRVDYRMILLLNAWLLVVICITVVIFDCLEVFGLISRRPEDHERMNTALQASPAVFFIATFIQTKKLTFLERLIVSVCAAFFGAIFVVIFIFAVGIPIHVYIGGTL